MAEPTGTKTLAGHPSTARRRFRASSTTPAGPDLPPVHAGEAAQQRAASRTAVSPAGRRGGRSSTTSGRGPGGGRGARRVSRTGTAAPVVEEVVEAAPERGGRDDGRRAAREAARQAARAEQIAARPFRSTSRVLVVEFLMCLIVVATKPFDKAHQQGQGASEGTIPQILSVMVLFALLAALGAVGPRQQRISNLFGGLVTLALIVKNHSNIVSASASLVAVQAQEAPVSGGPSLAPGELPPMAPNQYIGGSVANTLQQNMPTSGGDIGAQVAQTLQANMPGWRGAAPNIATPSGRIGG